jgi:hypothetical protein
MKVIAVYSDNRVKHIKSNAGIMQYFSFSVKIFGKYIYPVLSRVNHEKVTER